MTDAEHAKSVMGRVLDLVEERGVEEIMLTVVALGLTVGYGVSYPSWEKSRDRITTRVREAFAAYADLTAFDGIEGVEIDQFVQDTVDRIHHFVI